MSIRPSYGRRSVLQVLSDGMSQRPPTGKSCCEDAAQSAAEVDRLTRERDEAQEGIAAQRRLRAELDTLTFERDEARDVAARNNAKAAVLARERDELQDKLDAAENRPTLNREAVKKIVVRESHGNMTDRMDDALTDAIMALAPAVPSDPSGSSDARQTTSLPEWLGDVPDKPEAVKESVGIWKVDGRLYSAFWSSEEFRRDGYRRIALADAIEAEEDERDDDEQRIEEQAERLYLSTQDELCVAWESLTERMKNGFRAAIRAGWGKEADK